MNDCLFCKIAKKEVPSQIIYEDNHTLAFLDIAPTSKGHTLVISKTHSQDFLHMTDQDISQTLATAKKVGTLLKTTLHADGMNLQSNIGSAAGQVIFHTHIHLIPRYLGDGLKHWPGTRATADDLEKLATLIQEKL